MGPTAAPRHMDLARRRRISLLVAVICLLPTVGCLLFLASHPGRVAVKTVLIFPAVFEAIPIDPLPWMTAAPRREGFELDYSVGTVEGDLYLPGAEGRHGALILLLGARPLGRDEPILVRFAEGLSRAGAVVMIPASSNLAAGRVPPEEIDAIVEEVALLRGRDEVDPARIGMIGFSVGGSLAALAASDPRLAGQLAFVNTFGGYHDARDLVRAVASRGLRYAGVDKQWEPHPLTIWVVARQLLDTMPAGPDRVLLERIFIDGQWEGRQETADLSPLGWAIVGLLDGLPHDEVEPALASLPDASQERLRRISPSQTLGQIHTPLFVMHDQGDRFVPYTESRRLAAGVPERELELFTEFELFDHVVPDRPFDSLGIVPELAKLYWQIYRQMLFVL